MGSSKAPKTPDFGKAARVNQYNPYGSSTWEKGPSGWQLHETLSPRQQYLVTQQEDIGKLQNENLWKAINALGTPTFKQASVNDIGELMYGQITKDYDRRFAQDEAAQRAQLANQGFQMGSEGYQNTLRDFTEAKNRAYEDAAVQSRLASYDQYNTERGQNLAEYTNLMQILRGQPGVGPTGAPPQGDPNAPLDAMGMQYQADLNRSNAANAGRGQMLGTVGTLATAAAVAF